MRLNPGYRFCVFDPDNRNKCKEFSDESSDYNQKCYDSTDAFYISKNQEIWSHLDSSCMFSLKESKHGTQLYFLSETKDQKNAFQIYW